MADKIYVGNGRNINTQYGDLLKLSFTAEDVQKLQDNLDNGWINLVVKERREPSEKGTTHYMEVDTWKPDGANNAQTQNNTNTESEEHPF